MRAFILTCYCLFSILAANAAEHSVEDILKARQGQPIELQADSSDFDYDSGRLIFRGLRLKQGGLLIKSDLAETGKLDFSDGEWVFSGNIEIEAEATKLFCEEARIRFTGYQLIRAELLGTPARFEQVVAETGQLNKGEAGRMLYQLDSGILELQNNARFFDGANEISGDQITYDVIGRNLRADSGDSGPVTILIEPPGQQNNSAPDP